MSNQNSSKVRQLSAITDELLSLSEEHGFRIYDINRTAIGDMKRAIDLLRDLSDEELATVEDMYRTSLGENE